MAATEIPNALIVEEEAVVLGSDADVVEVGVTR